MTPNNTTDDIELCGDENHYPPAQAFIRLYLIFPVILFGVSANIVNVSIFARHTLRKSKINWFLLTLAASDLLLLLSTLFMLPFPVLAEKHRSFALIQAAEYFTRWFYPVGLLTQTSSVYLVVTVSAYRYMGICWPFWAQQHVTRSNVKVSIVATLAFAVVFNATRWAHIVMVPCYSRTFNSTGMRAVRSEFASEKWYGILYGIMAYLLVMFLLPFVTLCVINFQILRTVRKSSEMRKSSKRTAQRQMSCRDFNGQVSSVTSGGNQNTTDKNEKSITFMLVAVVALFLLCNSLPFVNNFVEILAKYSTLIDPATFYETFSTSVEIGNLLVAVNSSAYIFIYILFSGQYREALKSIGKPMAPTNSSYPVASRLQLRAYNTRHTDETLQLLNQTPQRYRAMATTVKKVSKASNRVEGAQV